MKLCEDCGKEYEEVTSRSKLCPECKKKHIIATRLKHKDETNARNRQKAMLKRCRQSNKHTCDKQIKCCDTYCHGCKHYSDVAGYKMCNYMLNTGKRRPCLGGEGCEVRQTGKERKRQIANQFI